MKKNRFIFIGILLFCLFFMQIKLEATPIADLEITVATDKAVYELGEDIIITVTAYNLEDRTVELTFPSNIQASYWMDDVYDWQAWQWHLWIITYATIEPLGNHTWQITHGPGERIQYMPDIGIHTLKGELLAFDLSDSLSDSVQFEVVPEPGCLLILTVGWAGLRFRKRLRS